MEKRTPESFYLPINIAEAIRRRAERTDTAKSRLILRYVRAGLVRDGALGSAEEGNPGCPPSTSAGAADGSASAGRARTATASKPKPPRSRTVARTRACTS